eukprot:CAMPEP_0183531044 /NCGR_PEP_ID=MMETSP0371-20130417/24551_1 /TAXON_ID=268820 /ORGANISM="Peridinium aciculiferum, Strain PAER-2" /LENGTH=97 /DNA_ID=CAMNT_0025731015 /DNA_START=167 /DNA_END=457 /DNA_ORIENTATION=-
MPIPPCDGTDNIAEGAQRPVNLDGLFQPVASHLRSFDPFRTGEVDQEQLACVLCSGAQADAVNLHDEEDVRSGALQVHARVPRMPGANAGTDKPMNI